MISGIVPRPIAFVSSVAEDGTENLAPFRYSLPREREGSSVVLIEIRLAGLTWYRHILCDGY